MVKGKIHVKRKAEDRKDKGRKKLPKREGENGKEERQPE
jgi:hypothetical protein